MGSEGRALVSGAGTGTAKDQLSRTSSETSASHPSRSPSKDLGSPARPASPPTHTKRKRTVEAADGSSGLADRVPTGSKAHSVDAVAQVCICQPDPKIPRPRNGEHQFLCLPNALATEIYDFSLVNLVHLLTSPSSLHPLSPAPSSSRSSRTSRPSQPRDIQDHWRAMANSITGCKERVERAGRGGKASPPATVSGLPLPTET